MGFCEILASVSPQRLRFLLCCFSVCFPFALPTMDREHAAAIIAELAADGQTRQQIAAALIADDVPRATAYRWIREALPEPAKPSRVSQALDSLFDLLQAAEEQGDPEAIAKYASAYIAAEAKARKM